MFIWILGVGAGCVVLALVLHFLVPSRGMKVPAIVLGTVGGFAVGTVVGMLGAVIYGESVQMAIYAGEYAPAPLPLGGGQGAPKGSGNASAPKKKATGAPKKAAAKKSSMPEGYPAPDEPTKAAPSEPKSAAPDTPKPDAPNEPKTDAPAPPPAAKPDAAKKG